MREQACSNSNEVLLTTGQLAEKMHLTPRGVSGLARAPEFDNMLAERMAKEDVDLFLRYGGQCLTGYNNTKRILVLEGEGDTTKTTQIKIVVGIVGQAFASQLRTDQLNGRFELFRYRGRPLLYGVDVPADWPCPGLMDLE